jgi:hypothetical protein
MRKICFSFISTESLTFKILLLAHLSSRRCCLLMMFRSLLLHGKMLRHASSHIVCKYFILHYCTESVISLEANVFFILILERKRNLFKLHTFIFPAVLWMRIRSRIRIRSDAKLFAGSGSEVGSGINHFGSGSGQPLSRTN